MSLEGKEPVKCGKYGSELGEFRNQYTCMYDDDDNLLFADTFNSRLQLLHGEQWYEIELQPQPKWPHDAVFDGNAIYVICVNRLMKYECVK